MLQLENTTPFRAGIAPLADEHGIDAMYVCVKATFTMRPRLALASSQIPIARVDIHMGEPGRSSLVEAGEHHLGKGGTDVVMHGCAHTQDGRPAPQSAVSVAVAERSKAIAVFGDRQWHSLGRVTAPQPFVEMPLVYERALGGPADPNDRSARELSAWNPVGVGLDRRAGAPVPNLEDPRAPIEGGGDHPRAVGFGPIAPGWQPRVRFAGTYDAGWVRKRSPLLPTDFSMRFFNCAAPELAFDRFLQGGEPVAVIGASRQGPIQFTLPICRLRIECSIAGGWQSARPLLETVALWPDDDSVSLTWRAKLSCDRTMLKIERVRILLDGMHGVVA
jgi:hypothetical protein